MMMRLLAVFFLLSLQITSADNNATELANNSTDFPDVGNFTSSPDDAVVNGSLSAAPDVSNFTTDLPVNETSLPANEASLPVNITALPAVVNFTTDLPVNETTLPVNETSLPANETTLPVNETSLPANETTLPVNETSLPANETSLLADETTLPVNETNLPINETSLPVNEASLPVNEASLPVNITALPAVVNFTTDLPVNETSLPANITDLPAVTNFTQPCAQVNGSVPAVNVTSEQFNQTTTTLGNGTRITVAPAGNVSSPFWNNTTSRRPLNVTAAPLASNRTINATATIGNGTDPGVLFPSPAPGNTTGEEKRGADSHSATGEKDDDKQSSGINQIVIIAVCSVLGVLVAVGVGFAVFWVIVKKKKSGGDTAKTPLLSEGQTPGSNKTTRSSSSAERV